MVIIKNAIHKDKCKLIINKTEHFLKSDRMNSGFDQGQYKTTQVFETYIACFPGDAL